MSSLESFPTVEEQRAFVYEYISLPQGSKGPWLDQSGVSRHRLRKWRCQLFADTLERGLVPRSQAVSVGDVAALKRLLEENRVLREELAERVARHEREIVARDEELVRQRRVVDALGKAIEILQPSGAGETSEPAPPDCQPGQPGQPGRLGAR